MTGIIVVQVNCASEEEAEEIATAALAHRLAAAANIHAPTASLFHWQDALETAEEVPLVLKTRAALFAALAGLIADLHSYETPAILGFPAEHVDAAYADWVMQETRAEA